MHKNPLKPDDVYLLHPEHASFLTEGVRRVHDRTTKGEMFQLWVLTMLTFLPTGAIIFGVYYLVFARMLQLADSAQIALFMSLTIMAIGGLWVTLGRVRKERQLELGGIELPGTIERYEPARSISLTGIKPVTRVIYRFVSTRGYQVIGSQLVSFHVLDPDNLPPPGTPVAVLYFDDKLHRIL